MATYTPDILQAIAYWAILAHIICEYSFVARFSKKPKSYGSYMFQFNSEPMKIEYADGETWYVEPTTVIFNDVCHFIPIEYDFTVQTERIVLNEDRVRKDTVYTMWCKFLIPGELTGYAYFDMLNKKMKKIGVDGILSFAVQDLYLLVKLVLKEIDPQYQKYDIHFRLPQLILDYDYGQVSARLIRIPEKEEEDTSTMTEEKPEIDQILDDFFIQQLPHKENIIRRIMQNQLNFLGFKMMQAKTVAQVLCILNEGTSYRPPNFDKCNDGFSKIQTEIFFLVNDKKTRNFLFKLFRNLWPTDSIPDLSPTEKMKFDKRTYLIEETFSLLNSI